MKNRSVFYVCCTVCCTVFFLDRTLCENYLKHSPDERRLLDVPFVSTCVLLVCVFFVGMCVWHEPRPIIFWSHCINLSHFSLDTLSSLFFCSCVKMLNLWWVPLCSSTTDSWDREWTSRGWAQWSLEKSRLSLVQPWRRTAENSFCYVCRHFLPPSVFSFSLLPN